MKVTDTIISVIVDHFGMEMGQVSEDSHIVDDLGADSLDCIELVMAFEEEFGRHIPDEDGQRLHTVRDVVAYVKDHWGIEDEKDEKIVAPPAVACV